MTNELHFYGLLHLEDTENTAENVSPKNFSQQIDIYERNALTFARTLALQGIPYTLLTNRSDLLRSNNKLLNVKEISFKVKVPSGIKFYSAHFKIDVFKYLAEMTNEYSILCDLDVVCINSIPNSLANIVKSKTPICYDISDQAFPAYGQDRIICDLELITDSPSEGRWYGGEFIGGTHSFFNQLYSTALNLMPRYLQNIHNSFHVGDEAIVSPAIELLKKRIYIADGGLIGVINRYWNCSVLHPQKPFAWCKQCFLVHLPADKLLLAEASTWSDNDLANFIAKYQLIWSKKNRLAELKLDDLLLSDFSRWPEVEAKDFIKHCEIKRLTLKSRIKRMIQRLKSYIQVKLR